MVDTLTGEVIGSFVVRTPRLFKRSDEQLRRSLGTRSYAAMRRRGDEVGWDRIAWRREVFTHLAKD